MNDAEVAWQLQWNDSLKKLFLQWGHFTLTQSVCVHALPVRHYWSQANRQGMLLDTVAKHRYVYV